GAPNVDDLGETALELVQVVGDVRGKISGFTILAADYTVLVVTKGGRAEPECAVFFVDMASLIESRNGFIDIRLQRTLRKPMLIMHAELAEVVLDVIEDGIQAEVEERFVIGGAQQLTAAGDQCVNMGFFVPALRLVRGNVPEDVRCRGQELLANAILQFAGDVEDILALVAVGGKA